MSQGSVNEVIRQRLSGKRARLVDTASLPYYLCPVCDSWFLSPKGIRVSAIRAGVEILMKSLTHFPGLTA